MSEAVTTRRGKRTVMLLQPGSAIGQFAIESIIAEGSALNVYKAFDTKRHRYVAIEMPTEHVRDPKSFVREARRVARIKHPNLIDIIEVNAVKNVPYIVAEFVAGRDLYEHILEHRDDPVQAIDLITQIADGLQAAHEHSVVHRDLNPTNVLVTDGHHVKIVDFGVRALQRKGEQTNRMLYYQAPEERGQGSISSAADIFSLGVVAYELFTGLKFGRIPADLIAQERLFGVPNAVRPVLSRMLEIDPDLRPTAQDVSRALQLLGTPTLSRSVPISEAVQVQLATDDAYHRALAQARSVLKITGESDRRHFFAVDVATEDDREQLELLKQVYDAEIVEDYEYDRDYDVFGAVLPDIEAAATLSDVLQQINAADAWPMSRGEGVAIAIVDTGVEGTRPEFPIAKRAGEWHAIGDDAWTDSDGHGTMCAAIAAACGPQGSGVAPDATIISCKVNYRDSQLALAYDYLADLAERGMKIVASNSWGTKTGTPPATKPKAQFPAALQNALDKGVVVVCSAGNYHDLVDGRSECSPTSIWLHKSRADVLTVGTCKLDGTMWSYSSRGPGQDFGQPNTSRKPDVTAPTPEKGRILYGKQELTFQNGWGQAGQRRKWLVWRHLS